MSDLLDFNNMNNSYRRPGMQKSALPNDEQREKICDLIASAFIELRYLDGEQAHDLAYALHNLPKEIYGWGTWSVEASRAKLLYYQTKHAKNLGFNYVDAFNAIFPLDE